MHQETPLDQISALSKESVEKLRQLGITTAEQLVSKASVPGVLPGLARQMGIMEEQKAQHVIDAVRACLHPDMQRLLSAKVKTETMGLGALPRDLLDQKGE